MVSVSLEVPWWLRIRLAWLSPTIESLIVDSNCIVVLSYVSSPVCEGKKEFMIRYEIRTYRFLMQNNRFPDEILLEMTWASKVIDTQVQNFDSINRSKLSFSSRISFANRSNLYRGESTFTNTAQWAVGSHQWRTIGNGPSCLCNSCLGLSEYQQSPIITITSWTVQDFIKKRDQVFNLYAKFTICHRWWRHCSSIVII